MSVFDLSGPKLLSGNLYTIAAKQLRTCPGLLIDFRPTESSFDLKASLGFFI
jgi:hypothetical protein